jgi:hypothetical protein
VLNDRLKIAVAITCLVALVALSAYLAASTPRIPTRYLETYKGFQIYHLQGNTRPYYIALSPYNGKCVVYADLALLKLDVDTEETEYSIEG